MGSFEGLGVGRGELTSEDSVNWVRARVRVMVRVRVKVRVKVSTVFQKAEPTKTHFSGDISF